MKSCILIGDSIRLGYQATVNAALEGFVTMWQPEENGGTSANILEHLDEWVLSRKPDIVHINCGLHDIARREDDNTQSRIDLDQYTKNVRSIFDQVRAKTNAQLLWARTTPVIEERHNSLKGFHRYNADINAYSAAVDSICKEMNIPIDNLHAIVLASNPEAILTADGVHYTDEGKVLLGKAVAEFIRAQCS